ncbi:MULTISPECIES: monofunctional biosynthetic peptidoglycan transglycosylase [unclassified Gilliamella]|uniref:monofunctional biosynthetic peptidoglycan transglycosylase n=1 Tax=unclassified Gilliamella TaxID=2685620 RepID=UPI00080E9720|nr:MULTISPECIES: monofunctional biosynthetic peptidoglycan transglycosylase [Gilliamella]MCX8586767.1 monofunctional biosynthetic peptidoglycan transglycosylase [Gilliamella sp. B3562]MCX8660854.1 monofunctional biosynthetic peptidoglycan transglycosylase [Gilliamella sp. B2772]MCX8663658.1 monofunctional biosynthetic peptidoglycan transglycosylase [Gilliamella sp. B2911]MCX8671807.1 monofunctional biosynthetic peptidoglycan transglycosylase [Gilliamella sp. B2785]MCX8675706.1 monofunctional b
MKFRLRKTISIAKKVLIGLMLFSVFLILLMRWVNPWGSMLMVERKIANWNINQQRIWKDWDQISDNIKIAVIAAEDQQFANHWGFDFKAINRALNYNKNNRKIRGASTITQQVAKNIFLWSSRNWIRKGVESWFTVWIELIWSKQRTLEIYLNSVEWGEGIFGIEAASRHYFGVSAKQLTKEQASLLAAILPNPRKWSPVNPNILTQKKAKWILGQMENLDTKKYLKKLN